MSAARITGGCQCGAVRYALHAAPTKPHICHCRMCQKAFGSYFAPFASVAVADFELTRGALSIFMSSGATERGFCRDCGTPLSIHDVGSPIMTFTLGSLDTPEAVPPALQYGIETRMAWFATLPGLPDAPVTEERKPERAARIRRSNHQHPDHDTREWPPAA